MQLNKNIFFIGMMGCGKSFWAKQLAIKLNVNYLDIDALIEEQEGMPIEEIFEDLGAYYFRQKENEMLKSVLNLPTKSVIACGGGLPFYFDNMELINENSISIYIKTPITILAERIMNDGVEKRPLIAAENTLISLEDKLSNLLKERHPFYEKATHIVAYDDIENFLNKSFI